ncbi:MAG: thiamine-phosphate synthase family protein [Desulfurococcaceae archaeon]
MVIIHEIASKKILPIIRGILVHELKNRGFSQYRISQILGITQPQVNKYLSKPIEYYYKGVVNLGFNAENVSYLISLLVSTIVNGYTDKYIILINSILHKLAIEYLCREHREICIGDRIGDPYIEYYREWVERILNINNIVLLIPEVGSNIVFAPFKPKDYSDVIGLTGRIVKAGVNVKLAGEPMYGGSRHLARTLILASNYNSRVKIAMNIIVFKNIERLGSEYNIVYSGPHDSIDSFWINIEKKLVNKPDILVDQGGYGLEPVTYLFVDSFENLEIILKKISNLLVRDRFE